MIAIWIKDDGSLQWGPRTAENKGKTLPTGEQYNVFKKTNPDSEFFRTLRAAIGQQVELNDAFYRIDLNLNLVPDF